jgi:hypothetical protein
MAAVPLNEPKQEKKNVVRFPAPAKIKNPAAVALGKLGGSKGGKIRAAKLSPEVRKTIAQQAAKARWAKDKVDREMEDSLRPSPEI